MQKGPAGLSIDSVSRESDSLAHIFFNHNGLDFDTDTVIEILIKQSQNKAFYNLGGNSISVKAVNDLEYLDSKTNVALAEDNLDGAIDTITIFNGNFNVSELNAGNISLSGVDGLSVGSVDNATDTSFNLTFAFDGTDFDKDTIIIVGINGNAYMDSEGQGTIYDTLDVSAVIDFDTVDAPTLSVSGGTYIDTIKLALSTETIDTEIYYTTDGTDPDITSNLYSDTIKISSNATIKAVAYKTGLIKSDISSETYTIYIPIGVQSNMSEKVSVYPNPASDYIKISSEYVSLKIIDASGKTIMIKKESGRTIDLNGLKKGTYIVLIKTSKSYIKTKLIIE